MKALPYTPDIIVTSYHGIPKYFLKGDLIVIVIKQPDCWKKKMKLKIFSDFQSRFGPKNGWLLTQIKIEGLPEKGIKSVIIYPGFSDCIETLEEIKIEARNIFK